MLDINVKDYINNIFINLKNRLNRPLSKLQMLIIFFFIYAFIGWILETLYCICTLGHFEKRGFLFGPLCPIYGYGFLILLIVLKPFTKNRFMLFISSAIIFSVFEYLVGYGLDALFSMKFWDYSNDILNINGRITLWFSIIWGVFGVLFIEFIHPFIEKITNKGFKKIDFRVQHFLMYFIVVFYVVDTISSSIRYLL